MAHLGGIVEGNCKLKEQNQPQSETAQTSANTETGTIAFSQIVVETLVPPFPLRRTRLPIYSAVERSSYLWLRSTQCVPQCATHQGVRFNHFPFFSDQSGSPVCTNKDDSTV